MSRIRRFLGFATAVAALILAVHTPLADATHRPAVHPTSHHTAAKHTPAKKHAAPKKR